MLTPIKQMSDREALGEFHQLLRECCADKSPPRPLAVRYQICRMALMAGELKDHLPGYVRQCMSSLRFREFIHLYDHDPAVRIAFIDGSLRACWALLERRPSAGERNGSAFSLGASEFDDFMIDRDEDETVPPAGRPPFDPSDAHQPVIARFPAVRGR